MRGVSGEGDRRSKKLTEDHLQRLAPALQIARASINTVTGAVRDYSDYRMSVSTSRQAWQSLATRYRPCKFRVRQVEIGLKTCFMDVTLSRDFDPATRRLWHDAAVINFCGTMN